MIHRYRVRNFKSLIDVEVKLSPVTVFVGRSGTGKSNFVESLRFLRDFLTTSTGPNCHQLQKQLMSNWASLLPATKPDAAMHFEIEFSLPGIDEHFIYSLSLSQFQGDHSPLPPLEERLNHGNKTLFHQEAVYEPSDWHLQGSRWKIEPEVVQIPRPGKAVLGEIPSIFNIGVAHTALTTGLGVYLFDDAVLSITGPKKRNQQQYEQPGTSLGLSDNAENYLDILKEIVSNLQRLDIRKNMVATLQRVNPSLSSVELNNIQHPDHIVVGHEFNNKTLALPLSQESCGFRRVYAHLLALYQQPSKQTLIFEHPEDGIHPGALALLADEFNAAPEEDRGQILLTTHSPEFLDHFDETQIQAVELDGFETRIGPLSSAQQEAIREKLLDAGELLTVDPARIENSEPESTKI